MKVIVRKKPKQFEAEQFLIKQKPWPDGVKKINKDQHCFVVNVAVSWAICDGDWIVHLPDKTDVMSNDDFRKHYDIVKK